MRIEDARKIVAVLMVTYQNYKPIDAELAAKIWEDLTEEYTYAQVNAGLKAYMKANTSGFAPVPSQIVEMIQMMIEPEELNEMEAWALVSKAIRNSGYNSTEEFAKLPPLVQKAVGLPGQLRTWALDEDYSETVVSSNFIKCYRAAVTREKEFKKIPRDIKELIETANKCSYSRRIQDLRDEAIKSLSERESRLISAKNETTDGIQDISKYRQKLERLLDGDGEDGKHKI